MIISKLRGKLQISIPLSSIWIDRDILVRVLIIPMIFTDLINSKSIRIFEGFEKVTILGCFLLLSAREFFNFYQKLSTVTAFGSFSFQ